MAIVLEDIAGIPKENHGGLNHINVYYAPIEDFTTIEAPIALSAGTTMASLAEISGTHIFPIGKGFKKITVIPETGEVESTLLGEKYNRMFNNKYVASLFGHAAQILGFARYIKNEQFIVLVEEAEGATVRQIGSAISPATISDITGKIAKELDGEKSMVLEFSNKSVVPAPIYKGTITTV